MFNSRSKLFLQSTFYLSDYRVFSLRLFACRCHNWHAGLFLIDISVFFFVQTRQSVYWEIEQRKIRLRLHLGKCVLRSAGFSKALSAICQLQTRNIARHGNKQMHYASTLGSADSNHRFSLDCRGDAVKRCIYLFKCFCESLCDVTDVLFSLFFKKRTLSYLSRLFFFFIEIAHLFCKAQLFLIPSSSSSFIPVALVVAACYRRQP